VASLTVRSRLTIRRHRNDAIGIGGVAHAEKKSQRDN
jgi:hypothetical protein